MDIDITYGIRASAPDLAGAADDEALPPARSRKQYRTRAIRNRLTAWVREQALPKVEAGPARDGHTAMVHAEGEPRELPMIGCDAAGFPLPTGPAIDALAEDYVGMPANGLSPDNGRPFEALIERCADIGARADRPRTGDGSVD